MLTHSRHLYVSLKGQVVMAPIFGYCVDRWCHRFHYVALAPLLWITSCSLLGFTNVHPMVALVFASLAGVINSAPLREHRPPLACCHTEIV